MSRRSELRQRPRPSRNGGADVANDVLPFLLRLALSAFLTVFLVRMLGPTKFGLFALAIGVSTIVLVLADGGDSIARVVAPGGPESGLRELIIRSLKLRAVITGLLCALLVALASIIAGADGGLAWPLRAAAVATFAQTAYVMALGISSTLRGTIVSVRLATAERLLEVSASVALVLAGAGASGAVFGRAIGYGLGAVLAASVVLLAARSGRLTVWRVPRNMPIADIYDRVASMFASDRSYALARSVSVLLLGAYAAPFASGIFMAPAALAGVGHHVGCLAAKRVTPRLAKEVPQRLAATLRALIAFQCLMLAPVVVWARPITVLLFGSRYAQSAEVLRALAPFVFFAGLAPLVARAGDGAQVSRRVSIYAGTLALAVATGLILIPRRGVVGGAIATDAAIGFYTLAYMWVCRRRFNLRIRVLVWALASALTAAAAMGIVLAAVGTKDLTAVDWVIGCAGGVAAYGAMLIFTREVTTAQVARAASVVSAQLAALKPSPREAVPSASRTPQSAPTAAAPLPVESESRTAPSEAVNGPAGTPSAPVTEAELACRRADAAGDAGGAFNLGVLLHQRRDFAAAAAAYERAELRGDRDAAFNLGILRYEQGDLEGAERAWRRCLSRHHAQAAANLGFLLERRGDRDGAGAAYAAAERWAEATPAA